jgi:hypothetical protein
LVGSTPAGRRWKPSFENLYDVDDVDDVNDVDDVDDVDDLDDVDDVDDMRTYAFTVWTKNYKCTFDANLR